MAALTVHSLCHTRNQVAFISGRSAHTRTYRCRSVLVSCATESGQIASNGTTRQTSIHKLIADSGALLVPGVFDALSAKIMHKTGHKAGFVSGYSVSAALLGEPDVGLLTAPEMARKTGQICAAVPDIPIITDADTGGGGPLNVQRTIRQLIAAGARGCFLEDQRWPKKCGHMRNKEVIPVEEHVAKIFAAREAIGDRDFFLVARTDARATSSKNGLDEAIARANVYVDAGADGSFVETPRSDYELKEIGKRTKGVRICSMHEGGLTPLHTVDDLQEWGFHLVVRPITGLYAVTRTMLDVYRELLHAGTIAPERLASFQEFNDIVGLEEVYALEERFGRGDANKEKLHVRVRAITRPYLGSLNQ